MRIVFFDIDGTLVRTGGAGSRAMNRAFEEVFGIPSAFVGVPMAGRTDRWILETAASRAGTSMTREAANRFLDQYLACLREALAEARSDKGVLPGVQSLLSAVAERPDIFPALLTGNCERGAQIKLEYFDLWKYFRCGAYGGDVLDRNDLFSVAMQRALECGAPERLPGEVVIVGDTVHDVLCARAAGARSLAVATGTADAATLRAAGADAVVDDLSDTDAILNFL